MNRYKVLEKLGEGTFGTVSRATKDGKQYAIKCMKDPFSDWNETQQQREFRAILVLTHGCPHLVHVFEILREQDSQLYFVCEYMPNGDLKDFLAQHHIEKKTSVNPEVVRSIVRQVLCGLQHIHSKGFMHRDLKPENLLMSGTTCKVADFSLARHTFLEESETTMGMTSYVSSRWYRAPELLLAAKTYTTAIDMFALGCIVAELHSLIPVFPGKDEHDQLPVILKLLGPLKQQWPGGARLLERVQINIPTSAWSDNIDMPIPERLAKRLSISDDNALSLLARMLDLNPDTRISAKDALQHSYFQSIVDNKTSVPVEGSSPTNHARHDASHIETRRDVDSTFDMATHTRHDASHIKTPRDVHSTLDMATTCETTQTPTRTPVQGHMTNGRSFCGTRRMPFVSISPNARNSPVFDDMAFANDFSVGDNVNSRRKSQQYRLPIVSKRDLSPSEQSFSSQAKRQRDQQYRPSQAFDID